MIFKKKRSIVDLLRAALVIVFVIGIPVWLLMIALITRSAAWCIGLIVYVSVSWGIGGRFENG